MKSAAEQIFVFRFFTEMEPKLLSLLFFKVLLIYLILTFIAMVLSADAIHSEPWIMNAYASEKWTAVIIVLLSFVVFVVIFIGYLGEKLHNYWLVNFFAFFVAMAAIFYGIVSIAAFR